MRRERIEEHPALWRADGFGRPAKGHVLCSLAGLVGSHIRRIVNDTGDSVRYGEKCKQGACYFTSAEG